MRPPGDVPTQPIGGRAAARVKKSTRVLRACGLRKAEVTASSTRDGSDGRDRLGRGATRARGGAVETEEWKGKRRLELSVAPFATARPFEQRGRTRPCLSQGVLSKPKLCSPGASRCLLLGSPCSFPP